MQEIRRSRRKRVLLLSGALVILFVAALGVVSRLPAFAIQGLVVENETSVPTGKIEALVRGELRGAYGLLIAKQTVLLYPKRSIRAALAAAFPEIGSVDFSIRPGRVLTLAVASRERHALWCGESDDGASEESSEKCFFLDTEGLVFAHAGASATSTMRFRYYGALTDAPHGTSTPLGARFLASAALAELENLRVLLTRDLSLEPIALSVVGPDALVRLASGTELYFSRNEPFGVALENLATLIASRSGTSTAESSQPAHNMPPGEAVTVSGAGALDGLEYVDLRFGNRLYYK
ncbi:MAG: hypothetical protein U1A28_04910 [Patescibacteria group bacterium]|nr:hypothetical protein [Patescibacteria group bacterium]